MNSTILKIAAKPIAFLQLLLSVYLLFKGHNEPGGGFIGGLIAASAFILIAMAFKVEAASNWMKASPMFWTGTGLLLSAASGMVALVLNKPLLTGVWGWDIWIPLLGTLKFGTPLFFDIGVYLVVVGIATMIVFSLLEIEEA